MKYAVNHPQKFRPIRKDYENETKETISYAGTKRRAFCAFLLGLNQCTISIVAEMLVIFYLSSLTSLILIIMKYVSLAGVVKFDNMYAEALNDHPIEAAAGCKLFISNKRQDRLRAQKQIGSQDDNFQRAENLESQPLNAAQTEEDARVTELKNSGPLQVMRLIHKFYRLYFLSLAFYFVPLGALLLSFLHDRPKK